MKHVAARAEIVRYCGLLYDRGLVTGSSGNVSFRVDDGTTLATPTKRALSKLRTGDIVGLDEYGNPTDPRQRATSELPLHLAAYRARPDVRCVVHTHPTFCVVWSKTGKALPCDTVGARETLGEIGCTPYRPPGSLELAELAAAVFATGVNAVLMERHGLSTLGARLEDAFVLTDAAEEAARIAYLCLLAGLA